MKRDPRPSLNDILASINKIDDYLAEIAYDKDKFFEDAQKQDSVIRRLEVIGEASKRLKNEFKQKFQKIPWKKMAGMRDVLIHGYDQVDLELVWVVVVEDLPALKKPIRQILLSLN